MDPDYYEITSGIDAREILRYLNDLGIHNISGEVLKYFITDLKKFIIYDLQKRKVLPDEPQRNGPERLHSASTFCSRSRSRLEGDAPLKCIRECLASRKFVVRNVHSAPALNRRKEEKEEPLRRACSCVRVDKKTDATGTTKTVTSSANLIKVPKQPIKKKCDPVSLYHYYTALWARYKSNVPGENNWADLRWEVRQKMAGCVDKQTSGKKILERIIEKDKQGKTKENL